MSHETVILMNIAVAPSNLTKYHLETTQKIITFTDPIRCQWNPFHDFTSCFCVIRFDVTTSYVSFLWGSNTQERDVTAGP